MYSPKKEGLSERWESYRETFSRHISTVLNDDLFPDNEEQFSKIIGDIFEKLTFEAALLDNYFEVLNGLTQYDMDFSTFWSGMDNMRRTISSTA